MLMWTALALALFIEVSGDAPLQADVVIRGAMVYDGTAKAGRKGDLAIQGDRIIGVGKFQVAGKPREIVRCESQTAEEADAPHDF